MPGVSRTRSEPNFNLSGTAMNFHDKIEHLRNSTRRSRPGSAAYLHDSDLAPALPRPSRSPDGPTNRSRAQSFKSDLSDTIPRTNRADLLRKRLISQKSRESQAASGDSNPPSNPALGSASKRPKPKSVVAAVPRRFASPLRAFESPADSDRLSEDSWSAERWSRPSRSGTASLYDFLPDGSPDHFELPVKLLTTESRGMATSDVPVSPAALHSVFAATGDVRSRHRPNHDDIDRRLAAVRRDLEEIRSSRVTSAQQSQSPDRLTSLHHRYFSPITTLGEKAVPKPNLTNDTKQVAELSLPNPDQSSHSYTDTDSILDRINSDPADTMTETESKPKLPEFVANSVQSALDCSLEKKSTRMEVSPSIRDNLDGDQRLPSEQELSQLFGRNPRRSAAGHEHIDTRLSGRSDSTVEKPKPSGVSESIPLSNRSYSHFTRPISPVLQPKTQLPAETTVTPEETELLRTESAEINKVDFKGRAVDDVWRSRSSVAGSTAKPAQPNSQRSNQSSRSEKARVNDARSKKSNSTEVSEKILPANEQNRRKFSAAESFVPLPPEDSQIEVGDEQQVVSPFMGKQKYRDILAYLNRIQVADADRISQISGREDLEEEKSLSPETGEYNSAVVPVSLVEKMFLEKRILTEICSQLLQQTKMTAEILSQMEMRQNQQRCSSPNSHAQLHKQPNEPPGGGNSRAKDDQFGLRPSAVDQNCQTDSVEWQEAAVQTDQLDQRPIVDSIEENAPAESSVPRAEADDQTEEKPDRTEQLENSSPLLSQNFSVNIHPSAGVLDTNESTIESGRKADNSCQPGAAERDMRPKLEADEQQNQKSRVEGEYSVQSSQTSKAITWEPDLLASDQNLPAASSVPSNQDQNVDTEATKLFSLTSETNKPVAEEQEASESYLASGLNGNEVVG